MCENENKMRLNEKERVIKMKMREAIVVGATGLVGSELIRQLCEREEYISVTALTRRKLDFQHEKLIERIVDFDELAASDIDFAHEVYCCLGTTIKKAGSKEVFEKVDVEYPLCVASLAKKRGIQHFIVISAMGANEKALAYYSRVKGKLEKELIDLHLPQLSIIRPSLLVGNRTEFRFGEKVGEWILKLLNPLMIGPLKKVRSISASQVALAMQVIALHGKKQKVAIYTSDQLLEKAWPPIEKKSEISSQDLFNWGKLTQDPPPLDEEIVFDKNKLNTK